MILEARASAYASYTSTIFVLHTVRVLPGVWFPARRRCDGWYVLGIPNDDTGHLNDCSHEKSQNLAEDWQNPQISTVGHRDRPVCPRRPRGKYLDRFLEPRLEKIWLYPMVVGLISDVYSHFRQPLADDEIATRLRHFSLSLVRFTASPTLSSMHQFNVFFYIIYPFLWWSSSLPSFFNITVHCSRWQQP